MFYNSLISLEIHLLTLAVMRKSELINGLESSPQRKKACNYKMEKNLFSFICVPVKEELKSRKRRHNARNSGGEQGRFCLNVDYYFLPFPGSLALMLLINFIILGYGCRAQISPR